jgi:hypothetical protein
VGDKQNHTVVWSQNWIGRTRASDRENWKGKSKLANVGEFTTCDRVEDWQKMMEPIREAGWMMAEIGRTKASYRATTEGMTSSADVGEMDKFASCDRGEMDEFANCDCVEGW